MITPSVCVCKFLCEAQNAKHTKAVEDALRESRPSYIDGFTLRFRGSSNQRVIDLKETRKSGRIICTQNGMLTDVDIDEGLAMEKSIQQGEVDVFQAMTGI